MPRRDASISVSRSSLFVSHFIRGPYIGRIYRKTAVNRARKESPDHNSGSCANVKLISLCAQFRGTCPLPGDRYADVTRVVGDKEGEGG